MPQSIYMPEVEVAIAFDSGYLTPAASRTWTDVTAYVEAKSTLSIQRGRADQDDQPQASRLTLTLDNRDGRFTPENAAGAYYPNVKKGRPIRVRVRWPIGSGTYTERFVGYVDEWPVEWPDDTSAYSSVTITAMSRQARLGRGTTLKSIVEEEVLYDVPVLYFPLGEPKGSTTAGNVAPGRSEVLTVAQVGTGGTLEFGEGVGPGTDDLSAPIFTPASAGNGLHLSTPLSSSIGVGGPVEAVDIECWFVTTTGNAELVRLDSGDSSTYLSIRLLASTVQAVFVNGSSTSTATAVGTVTDGALHHVSARLYAPIGGNKRAQIMLDGGSRVTDVGFALTSSPAFTRLNVGIGLAPTYNLFSGTLAHVAVYRSTSIIADSRITQKYQAGTTGFSGEASGARVARYARLAGIPPAEVSVETGLSTSIAHKDTTGETAIGLMQDVAQTEDGVVFDGKDGTLTFHARSHRYGATSAFTLSATAGDVEGGLTPTLDDQHLINDMTASRPNGITVRSTNDTSISEYGYYRESVEILTTSDNEVQSRADWEVQRFGTPRVSVPNFGVDLLSCSSGLITSLLAADIGTKFTVTGLPSQAPASTMEFFIEGYSERIGAESYGIEFNVSAAAYANVWQLDSASLSQLDSTTVLAY